MESKKSKQKKGYVVRYRYGTVPYRTVQIVNYFFKICTIRTIYVRTGNYVDYLFHRTIPVLEPAP